MSNSLWPDPVHGKDGIIQPTDQYDTNPHRHPPGQGNAISALAKSGVKPSILAFQTMPDLPNVPGLRATILDGQASSLKWTCELIHDSQYLRGSMAFR
jgi:hypothetical protein